MGFFDDPRTRRLKRDFEEMKKLQEESSILEFSTKGDPPEQYELTFHGKGLAGHSPIKYGKVHKISINLGIEYPRHIPSVHWQTAIVHPNINGGNPCFGNFAMNPRVPLVEVINILWDMTRLATLNPYGGFGQGIDWHALAKKIEGGFPLDPRILRDKVPPPQEPPKAEPGGEEFLIMGAAGAKPEVEELKREIDLYLETHGLHDDTGVLTQDEWKARGEKYGNEAPITITTEGNLGRLLNGHMEWNQYTQEELAEWDRFLDSLGLFWELGYAWSVHLYPKG